MYAIRSYYVQDAHGLFTYNLGNGRGYSVLEMVHAFEAASGKTIPYQIVPRRPGDIAECWAEPALARKELGWQAEREPEGVDEDGLAGAGLARQHRHAGFELDLDSYNFV